MAQSKCPKCENTVFEMRTMSPLGATFKVCFVQCSKCGTVVGVVDQNDTLAVLSPIYTKLGM